MRPEPVPTTRRVLVTGSRTWTDWLRITAALKLLDEVWKGEHIILVHGGAKGADTLAEDAARFLGWHTEMHPADWAQHGKSAGYVRNAEMVDAGADICLAFIKAGSKGATHTAARAEAAGIPTHREEAT